MTFTGAVLGVVGLAFVSIFISLKWEKRSEHDKMVDALREVEDCDCDDHV